MPSGITTSLISGLPSRETWTHGPDSEARARALSIIRTLRRLAPLHTPITDELLITLVGLVPLLVSCEIGIWIAIVWMLRVAVASTPGAAGVGIRCRFWN